MKKIFLFALCAMLTASCVFTTSGGFNIGSCTEKINDKTFIDTVYTEVQSLRVVQTPLPVNIEAGSSDTLSVKCYVEKMNTNDSSYRIAARMVGSALEIYQEPGEKLSFNNVSGYIDIRVPASVKNIVVKSVSGRIDVKGIQVDKLSATTVSGGVKFADGSVQDKLDAKSVSGGISLENAAGGLVAAETVSGGIRAQGLDFARVQGKTISGGVTAYVGENTKKVSFSTVSGGVRLFMKGDLSDNRYALSGVSGGIRVDGVGRGRRKFSFDGGNSQVDVRVKTVSGGITIRNW